MKLPCAERPDYYLTVSNARRRALNKQEMLRRKPEDAVFFKHVQGASPTMSQDAWYWPGAEVIASLRSSQGGLKNGLVYRVEWVREGALKLEGVDRILDADTVGKVLRPYIACTYFSIQGRTMQGRVRCCDTSHPRFTRTMLLVGISRCTSYANAQVE